MLNWVEHGESFITSGPALASDGVCTTFTDASYSLFLGVVVYLMKHFHTSYSLFVLLSSFHPLLEKYIFLRYQPHGCFTKVSASIIVSGCSKTDMLCCILVSAALAESSNSPLFQMVLWEVDKSGSGKHHHLTQIQGVGSWGWYLRSITINISMWYNQNTVWLHGPYVLCIMGQIKITFKLLPQLIRGRSLSV